MSLFKEKLAIRELLDRYCDGVNQRDASIWGDTWSENAIWEIPHLNFKNEGICLPNKVLFKKILLMSFSSIISGIICFLIFQHLLRSLDLEELKINDLQNDETLAA